jgi:hypothetical protein
MKDPTHWLYRFTAREWIKVALQEVERAEGAYASRDRKGGMATCRRAAGMAINGAMVAGALAEARYGRSYMDHVVALAHDETAPEAVREAAKLLADTPLPGTELILLRTNNTDQKFVEATKDVLAHSYALVLKSEPE